MGYRISYGESGSSLKHRVTEALFFFAFLMLVWIWKEKILLFLLFPGKETAGRQILSEATAHYRQGHGLLASLTLIFKRCCSG